MRPSHWRSIDRGRTEPGLWQQYSDHGVRALWTPLVSEAGQPTGVVRQLLAQDQRRSVASTPTRCRPLHIGWT